MSDKPLTILASHNKILKVWDLESGTELQTLNGHTDSITAVAVTPDGRLAVSASQDATLKVWNLKSGRELHTLHGHTDSITAVAVTPNGRLAVSASQDAALKVWDLESGIVLASFNGDGWFRACAFAQDGMTIIASEKLERIHFLRLEGL
jgi:WD40 repeat protein